MLKALLWKQFLELYNTIFNGGGRKTKKTRSGKPTKDNRGLIAALLIFIIVILMVAVAGMAHMLGDTILPTEFNWLYFAIFGCFALFTAFAMSVFIATTTLFNAKDNDLLLSLPIKPEYILFSRMFVLYFTSFVFSAIVWIPTMIMSIILVGFQPVWFIFQVLLSLLIPAFSLFFACLIGWVIAALTRNSKSKIFLSILGGVLLIAVVGGLNFATRFIMEQIISNTENIGQIFAQWLFPFHQLGLAAVGQPVSLLIFAATSLVLLGITYFVMSKTFLSIITTRKSAKKVAYKATEQKQTKVRKALLKKEFSLLLAYPTYIMNTCIAGILLVIASIVLIIVSISMSGQFTELFKLFYSIDGNIQNIVFVVILGGVGFLLSTDLISAPSVSLEGKNLWIFKSSPVYTWEVIKAKCNVHIIVNGVAAVISGIVLSVFTGLDLEMIIFTPIIMLTFVCITGYVGMIIGIKRANLVWTNVTVPIKQNIGIFFSLMFGWLLLAAMCAGYYFGSQMFGSKICIKIVFFVLAGIMLLSYQYLKTRSVKDFEELN